VAGSVDDGSVAGSAAVVVPGADDGAEEVADAEPLGSAAVVLVAAVDVLAPDEVAAAEDPEPADDVDAGVPVSMPLSSSADCTCCWTAWTWARTSAGVASAPSAEIASSFPRAAVSFACSSADGCCDTVTTIW
jgi:hypothetical protein